LHVQNCLYILDYVQYTSFNLEDDINNSTLMRTWGTFNNYHLSNLLNRENATGFTVK